MTAARVGRELADALRATPEYAEVAVTFLIQKGMQRAPVGPLP